MTILTEPKVHSSRSYYIDRCLSVEGLKEKARAAKRRKTHGLKGVEYDTIVGTGISGTVPLLTLAGIFKAHTMIVRKGDVDSHASRVCEGEIGHKWLFVDDFVSTGATFVRVWEAINQLARQKKFEHECVGAFSYANDKILFQTPQKLAEEHWRIGDMARQRREITHWLGAVA